MSKTKVSIVLFGLGLLFLASFEAAKSYIHLDDDENEAEQVLAREAARIVQLQDENHQILPGSWEKAWKQKQGMPYLPDAWAEFPNEHGPGPLPWNGAWSDVSQGLPALPIYTVVASPFNPSFIYVGTEQGVFASGNKGQTWSAGNRGPADVAVFTLFWMGPKLYAATFGRGLFWVGPATH